MKKITVEEAIKQLREAVEKIEDVEFCTISLMDRVYNNYEPHICIINATSKDGIKFITKTPKTYLENYISNKGDEGVSKLCKNIITDMQNYFNYIRMIRKEK